MNFQTAVYSRLKNFTEKLEIQQTNNTFIKEEIQRLKSVVKNSFQWRFWRISTAYISHLFKKCKL